MAFARYGYSVGATTSPAVGSVLIGPLVARLLVAAGAVVVPLPNLGWDELRSPENPATGDDVSNPPSWADVYICGGTLEDIEVSGRPFPYPPVMPRPPCEALWSL